MTKTLTLIRLLPAKTYAEMLRTTRKQADTLVDRARRSLSDTARTKLLDRAQALLGEAVELEMRRLAAKRGETVYRV